MTREIKFRGKCIDTGEWVYGDIIQWEDGTVDIAPIERDSIQYTVNPDTVGQYTGLKDRDGKEIYEGDIVRHVSDFNDEVRYDGAGFHPICLISLLKDWAVGVLVEVIGNIHDNPELLEEE